MTNPEIQELAASNSLLYGKGIFTTIGIVERVPFLFDRHWNRLTINAAKVDLDISLIERQEVFDSVEQHIDASRLEFGRIRVSFHDNELSNIWVQNDSPSMNVAVSILVGDPRSFVRNFRLTRSPFPINSRSPIAGVKSCNYLEPIMSLDEAKARAFHEAIRVNERGFVTSACMANVFWVKGGELFTPGLATGCLAGTTREFVLENIDCREVEVGIEGLDDAEAIFLTSAGIGVVQAAEFDGRRLEKVDHPILHLLPY